MKPPLLKKFAPQRRADFQRRLLRLRLVPPHLRALVLALTSTVVMEMAVIALAMIGWARFGMSVETAIHALTGVALFAGAVLAAAVLAGVARAPAAPRGVAGRLARLGIRALPTTGLLMMATWVVFMDDNLRTREDAVWPFTRTAMWAFGSAARSGDI